MTHYLRRKAQENGHKMSAFKANSCRCIICHMSAYMYQGRTGGLALVRVCPRGDHGFNGIYKLLARLGVEL